MIRFPLIISLAMTVAAVGCTSSDLSLQPTIASLQTKEAPLEPSVSFEAEPQQVIENYQALIAITRDNGLNGDILRRLSDLELEASVDDKLSEETRQQLRGQQQALSAIEGYQAYLKRFPHRKDNDLTLYQLARAYAFEAQPEKAQVILDQLVTAFPNSQYIDEVQFRRGEYLFVKRDYLGAERAYAVVVEQYAQSVYYEKSLYKYAWTQFKQNRNRDALDSYMALLDLNVDAKKIGSIGLSDDLPRADKELLEDVIRVISVAFSYEAEQMDLPDYFNRIGTRVYEPIVYQNLGRLYLDKDRITDAATTYLTYGKQYPDSHYTPDFHQQAINLYRDHAYSNQLLEEKIAFVNRYDVGSHFWQQQDESSRTFLRPMLSQHLHDLATHYHAQADISKKILDYQISASWYRRFLTSFPTDNLSASVNFLLAESLFDAKQLTDAVVEYEKTAYVYPLHPNSAEAGYAALTTYALLEKSLTDVDKKTMTDKRVNSALRFTEHFPTDPRVTSVLLSNAEHFYAQKQYDKANTVATKLTLNEQTNRKTQQSAWAIIAHSQYASQQFQAAEQSYLMLLTFLPKKSKSTVEARELVAASIYKQGELARNDGNHRLAAEHFSRLGTVIPESPKRAAAEYDAATAYIELEDWPLAIDHLELFRKRYPKQKKWQTGVSEKLALAYASNKNLALAATEMLTLSTRIKDQTRQRELMWRAADLYQQAGQTKQAVATYKTYVKTYPLPLDRSIELRHRIAQYYDEARNSKTQQYWLKEIVKADAQGKSQRSDRSKYLAANASMVLIKPTHDTYQKLKLTIPLKKSLKRKKKLMQQLITAYSKALKYQVQAVTTEATFNIADIYDSFAKALLESQRPKGLNEEELEEYDLLLEEQAYPFEEKAIDIHLANFKRIPAGSYDQAVKNSLIVLGELMPFRYAKTEQAEAYVDLP